MISDSLSYIVPPYLQNTFVGSKLQHSVADINERLSIKNIVNSESPYFLKEKTQDANAKSPENAYKFSSDPVRNQIIKEKVLYKLAIIGVLGTNPMEFSQYDDKFVYEMFEIFESRLKRTGTGTDTDTGTGTQNGENKDREKDPMDGKPIEMPRSVLTSDTVGEVSFGELYNDPRFIDENDKLAIFKPFVFMSSDILSRLLNIRDREKRPNRLRPRALVASDGSTVSSYSLPTTWSPLVPSPHLDILRNDLNLQMENTNGYSTISLKVGELSDKERLEQQSVEDRHYNFITDQPVPSSTGIFYYEIEVEQTATQSTNFLPLLYTADPSVSSNSSLDLLAGFTKRFVAYDSLKSLSSSTSSQQVLTIDLEKIKQAVLTNETTKGFSSADLKLLLTTKPGEFKGSFAVSYQDSSFHNSIKGSESIARTQILNMNRRLSTVSRLNNAELDSGKIDVGAPLKTNVQMVSDEEKVFKTDVIGCGVNFVNKSIFITLNGVLTTVITEAEMVLSHSNLNDLFEVPEKQNNKIVEIYPMIGFKLNKLDLSDEMHSFPWSSCRIITNLGFKEFKFDINNYINKFKHENQKFIHLSLLDKMRQNITTSEQDDMANQVENALLNSDDDSRTLNKLIKQHLNAQGFMDTIKSFTKDLKALSKNGKTNGDDDGDNGDGEEEEEEEEDDDDDRSDLSHEDEELLKKTNASDRQKIKNLMHANKFDEVLQFFEKEYKLYFGLGFGSELRFKVKKLEYMFRLKRYLERKLNLQNYEFEFEFNENERDLYHQAIECRNNILKEYPSGYRRIKMDELSSLLFVESKEDLEKFPKAKRLIDDYEMYLNKVLTMANDYILDVSKSQSRSRLKEVLVNVGRNVQELVEKQNDARFMLVNLEKDYYSI
ncbi:hypothetical protein KGF56_003119 [Candida oxycetoniae]|uniref:LisH domain-containing protein n=1 Tax=Candida oxycetoniae TaxID=497107 RepID=A0AAI9SVX9_9ASCO|nr:uncharacterized protein KGF56_003119 [Candida oxycetoniae]KAI3404083.2 hypothetical protein KGF56_003119 [Candida oxycetoniae]